MKKITSYLWITALLYVGLLGATFAQQGPNDPTFNVGDVFFNPNGSIQALIRQSDGKVVAGGGFSFGIHRYNSDGSTDNTFLTNIGTGFNGTVYSLTLQPDGKIIVGGWFSSYNGNPANCIIRLNSDGTRDNTFNIGTGFNSDVYSLALQPDGKIIVGGGFSSYNGNPANYIIRLNSDGTRDNTFNIGTGFNSYVNSLAFQPDGKIIVGGSFTSYNGNPANRIIRLNSDGTRDNTFNIGTGFSSEVRSLALQPDGKIIVGGNFGFYNGIIRNRIARLLNFNCPPSSISPSTIGNGTVGIAYTPVTFTQSGLTGTITWSATGLPAGLSLNSSTGVLSGTPAVAGTFNVTITATSSNGCSANRSYTLTITCPTMSFANTTASNAVLGSAYSLDVSVTGNTQPVTYSISPALPAGLSLNTSTGQITGTPTALSPATTYTVTATQAGPCSVSQTYTFAVVCPPSSISPSTIGNGTVGIAYTPVTFTQSGLTGTITWSATGLPAGLSLNSSTGVLSGTPAVAGTFNVTITATSSNGCSANRSYTLTITCPTMSFVNTTASNAVLGSAYSLDVSVTDNTEPVTYSISPALPAGLSLNTSTGQITGTPTALSPATTYTVTATQAGPCSVSQTYTFGVVCPTMSFVNTTASNAVLGSAYSLDVSVTGNTQPVTYSISPALPAGLSLNTSTGQITGTPTALSPATTYTVTATQAGPCSVSQTYTFAVEQPNSLSTYDFSLKVYPNPTRNNIVVECSITEFSYELYDIQGKKVSKGSIQGGKGEINLVEKAAGLYFLQVKVGNEVKTLKVSKQ